MRRFLIVLLASIAFVAGASPLAAAPALPRHSVLGAGVTADPKGLKVTLVRPEGPAASAGLKPGDIIMAVGGRATGSVDAFLVDVRKLPAGRTAAFTVLRDGVPLELEVLPRQAPDERDPKVDTAYEALSIDGSLRRTLVTTPARASRRSPAVLIVGGIGCYSVDNASDPEDSYMRLSHDLSRRGFLVLRLEKSGVGDSEGPPCLSVDFRSEERSYAAALASLERDRRVDHRRIFLFGHSIGSVIVPRLAQSTPIAGVVVAEGVGRDWLDYERDNLRRQLVLDHKSADEVADELAVKDRCMRRLLIEKATEADIERSDPACKRVNAYPASEAYMQQVASTDIPGAWAGVDAPVLAIWGSADYVTHEADHRLIVDAVNRRKPGNATYARLEGMDHVLHRRASAEAAFEAYARAEPGLYDTQLGDTVSAWLCAQARMACS